MSNKNMEADKNLAKLRGKIDKLDARIFKLLEERFAVVEKVGKYKAQNGLPVRNAKREKEIIAKNLENSGLDGKFIRSFYKIIFNQSYRIEK
ncbi:MAG: chorismate mutase [Candidatus Moranbacteria bacterium]|nr:chorismate mutase [Candidatus Moranbacteria bacterium]